MRYKFALHVSSGFFALCFIAHADAKKLGASVSVTSGESDNARKTREQPISERQDTYSLGLVSEYENAYLSSDINYNASETRYAEKSQTDRSYLEGAAEVQLGKLTDPIDVQLKHSRRTLLKSPEQLDLTNNQDQREILSVTPRVKKRLTDADLLVVSAEYTDTDFLRSNTSDSERVVSSVGWIRSVSSVSKINFMLQHADVTYQNYEGADYKMANGMLVYTTELRKLTYSLAMGYSRSDRGQQGEFSEPTYAASAAYNFGFNSFRLMASQAITDSSYGNGNIIGANPNPSNDASFKVDQIKRQNAEFTWASQIINERCEFTLTLHKGVDDYLVLPDELEQEGGNIGLRYLFSKQASLLFNYGTNQQRYVGELAGKNYQQDVAVISYQYNFNSGINTRIFVENEKREADDDLLNYEERMVGASLSYSF
jgi:hypothetical protein